MLNVIDENRMITRLAAHMARSPVQLNEMHGSDAEILLIPNGHGSRLALTTDTVAEEIQSSLYSDPWLIGWMTVMVNMSDLAAVGASPLGLLVAETLPDDLPEQFIQRLQEGIADACTACRTHVLGGDTNSGPLLSMTACAVGLIEGERTITRLGCSPGDVVFVSGPLGGGSAFAFAQRTGTPLPPYRPSARLSEGALIRTLATSCMDTSDGLLATLDQLMRLNRVGFALDADWNTALSQEAIALANALEVPDWFIAAGEHGEFELAFTIPENETGVFLEAARTIDWDPRQIGRVTKKPQIDVPSSEGMFPLDTGRIRNYAEIARRDVREYLAALHTIEAKRHTSTAS